MQLIFFKIFTVRLLWRKLLHQIHEDMIEKRKSLLDKLKNIQDFYMELRWELTTIGNKIELLLHINELNILVRSLEVIKTL